MTRVVGTASSLYSRGVGAHAPVPDHCCTIGFPFWSMRHAGHGVARIGDLVAPAAGLGPTTFYLMTNLSRAVIVLTSPVAQRAVDVCWGRFRGPSRGDLGAPNLAHAGRARSNRPLPPGIAACATAHPMRARMGVVAPQVREGTERRPGWRKTNAELYGDRPALPAGPTATVFTAGCGRRGHADGRVRRAGGGVSAAMTLHGSGPTLYVSGQKLHHVLGGSGIPAATFP